MRLSRILRNAARTSADLEALSSGNSNRIARRVENRTKGRLLARVGFWRWLWK